MKIKDLTLYVGKNEKENFAILINADNEKDALDTARNYARDSSMDTENWSINHISEFNNLDDIQIDCDYIVNHDD